MSDSALNARSESKVHWYMWAALSIIVARLWLQPLSSSFWLDETGTFLLVQGTFSEMMEKCARWSGQPTYYMAIVWLFAQLPGPREVILRLPSLIGLSIATLIVYRIGKRLLGDESVASAALIFASLSAYYASDARPYALGLMAASGAVLMLIRWADTDRLADALGYGCLAAVTVYFHFLFSVMFLVHAAYIVLRVRRGVRFRPVVLVSCAVLTLALLLPLFPSFVRVLSVRGGFTFVTKPRLASIALDSYPEFFCAFLVTGFLLALLLCPEMKFSKPPVIALEAWLLLMWAIAPPLSLFLISYLTPTSVLLPRYFSVALPGLALSLAWVFSSFGPPSARTVLLLALVAGAILDRGGSLLLVRHANEDWRGAMAAVKKQTDAVSMPVLVRSDFIESANLSLFTDPGQAEFLLAPQIAYRTGGILIPLSIRAEAESFQRLDSIVDQVLLCGERFLLVGSTGDERYQIWLRGRLHSEAFTSRSLGAFGTVAVILFERK